MKMKILTIDAPGEVSFRDIEIPEPGVRDVLVKVAYVGICGTDISFYTGDTSFVRDGLVDYPIRIGHEWSGVVEKTGSDVTLFQKGDRVVSDNAVVCGECPYCIRGNWDACKNVRALGTINTFPGAFAQYILFPEKHLHHLSDTITLEEATLIEPATIALAGIQKCSITPETTVVVIGTGSIGLIAVSLAKRYGAGKVIMIGRKSGKLEIAKELGADVCINITGTDPVAAVINETNQRGADLIIETSGAPDTINQGVGMAAKHGMVALIGFYETNELKIDIDHLVCNGISITGVINNFKSVAIVENIMASGNLNLSRIITHPVFFR
jgi:L-iditol 2-dehydrogenase